LFAFVSVFGGLRIRPWRKALMPFFHECSVYVCSNKDENLHAHADVQDLAAFAMLKALKLVSI